MIHLITLGRQDLRDDHGNSIGSVVHQPRRFALLVYLAIESRNRGLQRDEVCGMFWPESPSATARKALSQALWFLRRSLGADVIISDGDTIRICSQRLHCDAVDLLHHSASATPTKVNSIEAPRFLHGFFDSQSAEFEHWADRQRGALNAAWLAAMWAEVDRLVAVGKGEAASRLAREASILVTGDEVALRKLMGVLANQGDTTGALLAFDRFNADLEEAGDPVLSDETVQLSESIRQRGVSVEALLPRDAPATDVEGSDREEIGMRALRLPRTELKDTVEERTERVSRPSVMKRSHLVLALGLLVFLLLGQRYVGSPVPDGQRIPTLLVASAESHSWMNAEEVRMSALLLPALLTELDDKKHLVVLSESAPHSGSLPDFTLRVVPTIDSTGIHLRMILSDGSRGALVRSISKTLPSGTEVLAIAKAAGIPIRVNIGRELKNRNSHLRPDRPHVARLIRMAEHNRAMAEEFHSSKDYPGAWRSFERADSMYFLALPMTRNRAHLLTEQTQSALRQAFLMGMVRLEDTALRGPTYVKAIKRAEELMKIRPHVPEAPTLMAEALYHNSLLHPTDTIAFAKEGKRAEDFMLDVVQQGRATSDVWLMLSMIQKTNHEYARAYASAREALLLDPFLQNGVNVRMRLRENAMEIGDMAAARMWCDEVAVFRQEMGWDCSLQNMALQREPLSQDDLARARQIMSVAGESTASYPALQVATNSYFTAILTRSGLDAEARERSDMVAEFHKVSPVYFLQLAYSLIALREYEEALNVLKERAAKLPHLPLIPFGRAYDGLRSWMESQADDVTGPLAQRPHIGRSSTELLPSGFRPPTNPLFP